MYRRCHKDAKEGLKVMMDIFKSLVSKVYIFDATAVEALHNVLWIYFPFKEDL